MPIKRKRGWFCKTQGKKLFDQRTTVRPLPGNERFCDNASAFLHADLLEEQQVVCYLPEGTPESRR
eukprot:5568066-Amphidinium_carterae.2